MLNCEIVNMKDCSLVSRIKFNEGQRLTSKVFKAIMQDAFITACIDGIDADLLMIGFYYSETPWEPRHCVLAKTVVDGSQIDTHFYYDCDPEKLIRTMNIAC